MNQPAKDWDTYYISVNNRYECISLGSECANGNPADLLADLYADNRMPALYIEGRHGVLLSNIMSTEDDYPDAW